MSDDTGVAVDDLPAVAVPPTPEQRRTKQPADAKPKQQPFEVSDQGLANSFCRYAGSNPASLAMASSIAFGGANFRNRLPSQVLPLAPHWQKNSGLSVPYTTFFSNR